MITLKEAKNYLRVEHSEVVNLFHDLHLAPKKLFIERGRMDEEQFAENEDTVRTAIFFTLGYLYENRTDPDYHALTLHLRSILFAQREGIL